MLRTICLNDRPLGIDNHVKAEFLTGVWVDAPVDMPTLYVMLTKRLTQELSALLLRLVLTFGAPLPIDHVVQR